MPVSMIFMSTAAATAPTSIDTRRMSDGSWCRVIVTDATITVERQVDGATVWGQCFSANPAGLGPERASECVIEMRRTPTAFTRCH